MVENLSPLKEEVMVSVRPKPHPALEGSFLKPVFNNFWLLRLLGWPIVVVDSEDGSYVRYAVRRRWLKCFVFPFLLIGQFNTMFTIMQFGYGFDWRSYFETASAKGVDRWDIISSILLSFAGFTLLPVAMLRTYRDLPPKLERYESLYAAAHIEEGHEEQNELFKPVKKRILTILFLTIPNFAALIPAMYLLLEGTLPGPIPLGIIWGFQAAISTYGAMYPPAAMQSLVLDLYLLRGLRHKVDRFGDFLKAHRKRQGGESRTDDVNRAISLGYNIESLAETTNSIAALPLTVQLITYTVAACCTLYLNIGLSKVLFEGSTTVLSMLFGIQNILSFCTNTVLLGTMLMAGQDLANSYKAAKRQLLGLMASAAESVTLGQRRHLEAILDHFSSSVTSPLRPFDAYDVNLNSAVSLVTVIITYMIVLLQFKIGDEKHQKDPAEGLLCDCTLPSENGTTMAP